MNKSLVNECDPFLATIRNAILGLDEKDPQRRGLLEARTQVYAALERGDREAALNWLDTVIEGAQLIKNEGQWALKAAIIRACGRVREAVKKGRVA